MDSMIEMIVYEDSDVPDLEMVDLPVTDEYWLNEPEFDWDFMPDER